MDSGLSESTGVVRSKISNLITIFTELCWKFLLFSGLIFYLVLSLRGNPTALQSQHKRSAETPTNLSHIVFAIAGSAKTWPQRRSYVDVWWRPNKTRGFVWLDRAPSEYRWPNTSPPYRVSENVSRFKPYDRHGMHFAIRMTRVVLEAFRAAAAADVESVRWFVMADDDTVLFVDNLVEMLAKHDHRAYYYIGGISECVSQNSAHSFRMAFGGAGYAISYPLAKTLSRILDGCITRYPYLYGSDHMLQSCMSELGVSLTRHPGFHQLDLHGDMYGLLSSHPQARLLSLHHLDFVDPIFPSMTRNESLRHLMSAAKFDSSRLLQQSVCYDAGRHSNWSFSVSWGFTVQIYEDMLSPGFLEMPLQTFWPWNNRVRPPFMFNARPVTNDPCLAPHIFFFETLKILRDDKVVTNYVRKMPRKLPACRNNSADGVLRVRVFSRIKRFDWEKGRRECCEVVPAASTKNTTDIWIKDCSDS